MGRARSNTKRRPKGKRGWKKIDPSEWLNGSNATANKKELSLNEKKENVSKLTDSQIFKIDNNQKRKKKLSKQQIKIRARNRLLSMGHVIDSTQDVQKYRRQQRLKQFKLKQKKEMNAKKGNFQIQNSKKKKTTMTIKFRNNTVKTIKTHNHENIAQQKKELKNNKDYTKNDHYNLYELKHSNKNKTCPIKDIWECDNDNPTKKNKIAKEKTQEINAKQIIKKQLKANKGHWASKQSAHNKWIKSQLGLSLPHSGESINPRKQDFCFLKWKSLQAKAKTIYKDEYQTQKTEKWFNEYFGNNRQNKKDGKQIHRNIEKLQKDAQKMRNEYYKHESLYQKRCKKLKTMKNAIGKNNLGDNPRQISNNQMRKERIAKLRLMNKKKNGLKRKNWRIHGPKFRFHRRTTPMMKNANLNQCLRKSVNTGVDDPVSFLFNQMQMQNKVCGNKRKRFVLPRKKAFHGPRYKVQTKIGRLFHGNVGNKLFKDMDSDED